MEAPTYQQLIQMLSKAESEAGDDSGSLPKISSNTGEQI